MTVESFEPLSPDSSLTASRAASRIESSDCELGIEDRGLQAGEIVLDIAQVSWSPASRLSRVISASTCDSSCSRPSGLPLGESRLIDARRKQRDLVFDLGQFGLPLGRRIGLGKIFEALRQSGETRLEICDHGTAALMARQGVIQALRQRLDMHVEV